MLSLFVRVQNWLASEKGQWNNNGLLLAVLIVLGIIAVGAWIIFNVDISEK